MKPIQCILIPLLMISIVALDEQPYCTVRYRRLCQGKGPHVTCQYTVPGPGPNCKNYTQIKFTSELRHFITNYINRRRQRVAAGHERVRGGARLPRPQIMMFVEWDRELSSLAQRLADQCNFVHDDCRATVRYPYAGQTVGEVRWRRSSDSDELSDQRAIRRVFDAWWGEKRRVEPKQLTAPFRITVKGSVWGHFSQIAVWKLRTVGCGAVRHGIDRPRLLLVCDFSHTNMLGQRTIVPGKMAHCPGHTARIPRSPYSLLCAPVRHSFHDEPIVYTSRDENPFQYGNDDEDRNPEDVSSNTNTTSKTLRIGNKRISLSDEVTPQEIATIGEAENNVLPLSDYQKTPRRSFHKLSSEFDSKEDSNLPPERPKFWPPQKQKDMAGHRNYKPSKINNDAQRPRQEEDYEDMLEEQRVLEEERRFRSRVEERQRVAEGKFNHWKTRNPSVKLWHGHQDNDYEPSYDHRRFQQMDQKRGSFKKFRSTTRSSKTTLEGKMRHRWNWQQTRDRPMRPGANALLFATDSVRLPADRKSATIADKISFTMDAEDVNQLFQDTGFHPNWKKTKN